MANDDIGPDSLLAFGSDPLLALIGRLGLDPLEPQPDSDVLMDLLWTPSSDLWNGQFNPLDFPMPPFFDEARGGASSFWSGIDWEDLVLPPLKPDPEPEEPVLTPVEVVIDHPTFGRMQLGYSPGVDLSQPVALTLDHPRFGMMTLGWILPPGYPDPYAPTTGVIYEETPFQPPAQWKSGPLVHDGADDVGGSDAGAEIQPASWSGGEQAGLGNARAKAEDGPETVGADAYDLAISRRQADAVAAARAVRAGQSIPQIMPQPKAAPVKAGQHDVPPPIDVASLPPGPLGPADYERAVTRNRYLAGLYDPESMADRALNLVTGAMNDSANVLTPSERAEHLALNAKFRETLFPTPTPQEARLDAMLASPIGTAASVAVGAVGGSQRSQDDALATGSALEGVGMAVGSARRGEASDILNAQIRSNSSPQPLTENETLLLRAPPPPHPPLTAEQQVRILSGHGDARHGPNTTMQQHETRVLTGQTPDGKYGKTSRATRFDSYEAEVDAVQRAIQRTEALDAAGLIPHVNVVTPAGVIKLPRIRSVVTGFPGGYGSGVLRNRGASGSTTVSPTGQDPNAVVVLERDPKTGKWNPVTQYPTDEPTTP